MEQKFNVTGMTCSACSSKVEREVSKLEGINKVTVNLLTNSMQVDFDENITSNSKIIATVVKAGYDASAMGAKAFAALLPSVFVCQGEDAGRVSHLF